MLLKLYLIVNVLCVSCLYLAGPETPDQVHVLTGRWIEVSGNWCQDYRTIPALIPLWAAQYWSIYGVRPNTVLKKGNIYVRFIFVCVEHLEFYNTT